MRRLYERALGTFLAADHASPDGLDGIDAIADVDLWAGHVQQKRELTDFIASRLARQFARRSHAVRTSVGFRPLECCIANAI